MNNNKNNNYQYSKDLKNKSNNISNKNNWEPLDNKGIKTNVQLNNKIQPMNYNSKKMGIIENEVQFFPSS